jgi:hypothetical protein
MRLVAIALVTALLAACAGASTPTCYKTQRTGKEGGRSLVAYACSDQQVGSEASAGRPVSATPG